MHYIVKGGIPLNGHVDIGGDKNAALPIICAAVMTDEEVTLENIPDITDVNIILNAISDVGVEVRKMDRHTIRINASKIRSCIVEDRDLYKIRASYYLLGALLGRFKEAIVPIPGGNDLGPRPIDMHTKAFRKLGADVKFQNGRICIKADALNGAEVYFDVVSVGATINAMMAAVLATGKTILVNASKDPWVVDVAGFLNSMGADIRGAGTDIIRIRGVSTLHGCNYRIIPDRIEAGTFMAAAAATKGDIIVENVIPAHMEAIISKLVEIGCKVEENNDTIHITSAEQLHPTHIKVEPYPGFPTNMHPQMSALLIRADGTSIIQDYMFPGRFVHDDELKKMGADIRTEAEVAIIDGVEKISVATVTSTNDIRGVAALVIAALQVEGYSKIKNAVLILRGYEDFDEKLRKLGANIKKVDGELPICTGH